ncbi:phage baseplate assembly protein [Rhodospirillum sp. A1_3_36]|uniref:phage baseplate assembly protein n=1 Tax=Rhodospirillum sp. A1_3_36 TaxID=3391666 RepID=UPI0039A76492
MTDTLALTIDGQIWTGWTDIEITGAIDRMAWEFKVGITETDPDGEIRQAFGPQAAVQVHAGEDLLVTGFLDACEPSYDDGSHGIALRGRSATGDLVDCSVLAEPSQWRNIAIDALARVLCKPFGIAVRLEGDAGPPIRQFQIEEGETVHAAIERACRWRGLLPTAGPDGALVLTTGGAGGATGDVLDPTASPPRIKAASGQYDVTGRFSTYVGKGQGTLEDGWNVKAVAHPRARVVDPEITRYRPLLLVGEELSDNITLTDRLSWEARVRAGRSRTATVTVQGWRDAFGKLWRPNTTVHLVDDWLAIDLDLLITAVAFRRSDDGGTVTELTLAHPDAWIPEPGSETVPATQAIGWHNP